MKNKSKKIFILCLLLLSIFGTTISVSAKSYYSYKQLGLDYKLSSDKHMYGASKNGYKLVQIIKRNGNKIYYKYAKFQYDSMIGHAVFVPYGKTYVAKLTSSTKFYQSNYQRSVKLNAPKYAYKTTKFKSLKFMERAGNDRISSYSVYYIKVKNKKIQKVISPLIFAV